MFCLDETCYAVSNLLNNWDELQPPSVDNLFQACLDSDIFTPIAPVPDLALDYAVQDLIYDHIEGDFYWANYGEFKVVMMQSNGYINATQLCETISFKPYRIWTQNVSTKHLIDEFIKISKVDEWFKVIKKAGPSNCKQVIGTYIHPDLIHSVVTWAAPMQALCVNKIMRAIIVCNNVPNYVPHITNKDTLQMIDAEASVVNNDGDKLVTNVAIYAKCIAKEGGAITKEHPYNDYQYLLGSSKDLKKLEKNTAFKKKYPHLKCVYLFKNVKLAGVTKYLKACDKCVVTKNHIKCKEDCKREEFINILKLYKKC